MFREVFDEPSIEVGESEEGLHLLLVRRSGPLGDAGNLDLIHRDGVVGDDDSEVFDRSLLEFAVVGTEVKLMFFQKLQNAAGDLPVMCLRSSWMGKTPNLTDVRSIEPY